MKKRPMKPLFDVLIKMGAKITYLEEEGFLPIKIQGIGKMQDTDGPLHVALDISKSTQFLSALLLISPMLSRDSILKSQANARMAPILASRET